MLFPQSLQVFLFRVIKAQSFIFILVLNNTSYFIITNVLVF